MWYRWSQDTTKLHGQREDRAESIGRAGKNLIIKEILEQ